MLPGETDPCGVVLESSIRAGSENVLDDADIEVAGAVENNFGGAQLETPGVENNVFCDAQVVTSGFSVGCSVETLNDAKLGAPPAVCRTMCRR